MDEKVSLDFSQVDKPVVIRNSRLDLWPCFQWTLNDWSEKSGPTKFAFRVHNRSQRDFWETEAIDRFETDLKNYIQWTELDAKGCDSDNPFKKYPKSDFWVYSSYNYLGKMFENNKQIIESVDWSQLGLDSKLDSNATNSTIWIGSEGAFTPCHQDSYGYNFVAQISGKKLWILFPPSDGQYLYPTRIPYEESSVFSSVDFLNPDYESHPLFKQTSPHIIELNTGDILYVPHHWWHFVRVIEEDPHKTCISINNWIFNDCYKSSLNESIVRLLTTALFNTYSPSGQSKWLNTNSELFTPEEAIHSVVLMLNKCKSLEKTTETTETNVLNKQTFSKNCHFIESSTFNEMENLFNNKTNNKFKTNQQIDSKTRKLNTESIINCILDPDVIELIAKKLENICIDT